MKAVRSKKMGWFVLALCLLGALLVSGCYGGLMRPGIFPPGPTGEDPAGEPVDGGIEPGPSDPEPLPDPEPDLPPEPDVPPDPEPDLPEPEPDDVPGGKDPIIYIGQIIKVPGPGNSTGKSQVVHKSLLNKGAKQVALTFDSGWLYESTLPLLDVLDEYDIKATFFPRALWVYNPDNPKTSYPDLAREIVSRGHTMGNHSLTHPDMTKIPLAEARREIRESTRLIQEATEVRPYLFRPPYGAYNQEMLGILGEEGYPYTIMWTIDTHDWAKEMRGQKVTADYIVQRVLDNIADGGIVLMHIGGEHTVEALPRMIQGLKAKGYSFTTVDRMVPAPESGENTYTIQKGDTLYSLARKYNTTVEGLIALNDL